MIHCFFFFSSRRRHTRCTLVTGVQTCALPICKGSPTKEYTFGVAISSDSLGKALASEAPQPPFDEANIASPDLVFLTLPENPNGQFPLDFPLQCIVQGCPGSGKSYRLAENAKTAHYVFRTALHPERPRAAEHMYEITSTM